MLTSNRPSDNILSHWYALQDNFQFSTREFYDEIEKELAARQVPGLKISRVDFLEGGVLSDKRTYLRLTRERYAFEVCAAPFGRGYFFSLRLVEKPRSGWVALLVLVFLLFVFYVIYQKIGATILIIAAIVVFAAFQFKSISASDATPANDKPTDQGNATPPAEVPDLDGFLLNFPVFGEWYGRFRKETYYRFDTRIMYQTLITEIVKKKAEEVTAAKGIKLVRSYEYSPILGELYKPAPVKPNISTASPPSSPI